MRALTRIITALALLLPAALPAAQEADRYIVLSYHDVQDDPARDRLGDAMTIATSDLIAQFAWLGEHDYHPVSLDDIVAAREHRRPLPANAVLLTFDDGYASTYTRVFPLLRLFGYPAVIAPMVSWIEQPAGSRVEYGALSLPREGFATWDQLKEMADSGLVEIASHSYDLHHGIVGNPQGNLQPAAVTRAYDPDRKSYEDDKTYINRIGADLQQSVRLIEQRTGHRPRAMVWPFGRYNEPLTALASQLGMPLSFDLGDHGYNSVLEGGVIHRALLPHGATLESLIDTLNESRRARPIRTVQVDLDYVFDPDPAQQERNLDRLLDRIKALGINTVYLQAFADPDGDGAADALYFPNRHLPVRADLFNRVAWQLATRAGVKVYAWLPVLAYVPEAGSPLQEQRVQRDSTNDAQSQRYPRLSPFSAEARDFIGDIYEDLARHASIDGLLFHDDATLAEDEDASDAALEVYTQQWGLPATLAEIHASPELMQEWTRRKTESLINFTDMLAARVREFQPQIKTARNLYAPVALDPAAESRFAQSLPLALEHYDYTAILAMPYLEAQSHPRTWLKKLVAQVSREPDGLNKTVFELQSVDWRDRSPVDAADLRAQMDLLRRLGVRHLGYYPDDFIAGRPDIAGIRPAMSLSTYPYPE
ncbi:MAG: poly-beta-1,6-N-acetyl-D-glucosamine N-deacetylase PgaB [Gammaproteobacteria bacterium]|nr:poly-beta-1,6-N-acetyl-D-glucosamine N-deacetylase PgaB [Gammaproteobacteria bacterium]